MAATKRLLLVNFHAGQIQQDQRFMDILQALAETGETIHLRQTEADWHIPELTDKAYEAFWIAGGDGSFNRLLNALADLRHPLPPLGFIPLGTTCDLARSLGLMDLTPKDWARTFQQGRVQHFDLGQFNQGYFCYIAAFGALASVAAETPRELKENFGHMAYMLEGLRSLNKISPVSCRVRWNEGEIEEQLIFASICNTRSVGGILQLPEDCVNMQDGVFECILIRQPQSAFELPALLNAVLSGHYENPNIYFFSASHLTVDFEKPQTWVLDGEGQKPVKHVEIRNWQQQLPLILPAALDG